MKNVVPFKAPEPPNGLVSLVLLALVSRRQGAVAKDLQAAADFAETLLALQMRKHQGDALDLVQTYLTDNGRLWT